MEDYITLDEIYIHDPKLFKTTKNLKSFVKNHKIQENDMVLKGAKILGIKKNWIKKYIPSFNLKLQEFDQGVFFEVLPTLEKYLPKIKTFNPITFNLDSTTVKYFIIEGKRIPYFTKKGYVKIERKNLNRKVSIYFIN